jgi:cell division protease FtsH
MGRQQNISEATSQKIDTEVRRLVETGHKEATRILTEKRDNLEILAKGLLEYETLSGEEILGLFEGNAPVRDSGDEPPAPRSSHIPSAGKPRPKPDTGMEPQPQA